ncbi:hypothetical protein DRH14_05635 [Candidatus Shapirobacteria bacterium]|nr:MAG: hypothetical protein DRH14_05635 [Candidatus Shapirobacteria bacterium]
MGNILNFMLTDQIRSMKREAEALPDLVVVVEGKKDKAVLEYFGFKNVIEIAGKPLEEVVDEVKEFKEAAILTDFDDEGRRKASRLAKLFNSLGIKNYFHLRRKFKRLFKVCKVEELFSLIKLLGDDYYGETCSIHDKIFNRSRIFMRRNSRKARCNRGYIRPD